MAGALSAFTTYIAIAPDRVNAQLTSAIIATATSLPITNINFVTTDPLVASGASYSAIIVDGPLTEVVALTGNLSAGAVPCAATANAHSAFAYVVFQLTASIGPTAYIPAEKFQPEDVYDQLADKSARGSAVDTVGSVQGMRTASVSIDGAVFADTFPYIAGGIFGSEDVTGAGPYAHALGVLNTTLSGSTLSAGQPVRYIIYNFDGNNTRIFCGRFTDLTLTADPKQLLKYSTKFLARASGVVSNPTKSFGALVPLQTWTGIPTVNAVVLSNVLSAEITFSRLQSEAVPTIDGNQDPYDIFLGALSVKGKFSVAMQDDTIYAPYVNNTQPVIDLKFTRGTGGTQVGVEIHVNQANITKCVVSQQGKAYVVNNVEFEAIGNSTDATATGTGLSPCKLTLTNATSGGTNYT